MSSSEILKDQNAPPLLLKTVNGATFRGPRQARVWSNFMRNVALVTERLSPRDVRSAPAPQGAQGSVTDPLPPFESLGPPASLEQAVHLRAATGQQGEGLVLSGESTASSLNSLSPHHSAVSPQTRRLCSTDRHFHPSCFQ